MRRTSLASFSCGESHVDDDGRRVVIPVRDLRGVLPLAVRRLDEARVDVQDVGVRHSTLDDVFFALTGRVVADEDEPSEEKRSA